MTHLTARLVARPSASGAWAGPGARSVHKPVTGCFNHMRRDLLDKNLHFSASVQIER